MNPRNLLLQECKPYVQRTHVISINPIVNSVTNFATVDFTWTELVIINFRVLFGFRYIIALYFSILENNPPSWREMGE